jgi:hypothetical protein
MMMAWLNPKVLSNMMTLDANLLASVKTHNKGDTLDNVFLVYFILIWGKISWFHLLFWWTCNTCFDTKASKIILVIFQMRIFFQQNVFFNIIMFVWMKNLSNFFCEITCMNFSYRIEIIQLIHIQYMIRYFIKCCNYLNHF